MESLPEKMKPRDKRDGGGCSYINLIPNGFPELPVKYQNYYAFYSKLCRTFRKKVCLNITRFKYKFIQLVYLIVDLRIFLVLVDPSI